MSCVYSAGSESFAAVVDTGELAFNMKDGLCLTFIDWFVFGQFFEDSPDAQVAWDAILCGQDVSVMYWEVPAATVSSNLPTTKVEGTKALWPEAIVLSQSPDSQELGKT